MTVSPSAGKFVLDVIANVVVFAIVISSVVERINPEIEVDLIFTLKVSALSTNKSAGAVIEKEPVPLLIINDPLIGVTSVDIVVV